MRRQLVGSSTKESVTILRGIVCTHKRLVLGGTSLPIFKNLGRWPTEDDDQDVDEIE